MKKLTIVYNIPEYCTTVEDLTSHPAMSKCSWSDSVEDRDGYKRDVERLKGEIQDLLLGISSLDKLCGDVLIPKGYLSDFVFKARAVRLEQDKELIQRCCSIVVGYAGSDNVAQRTVDALRKILGKDSGQP